MVLMVGFLNVEGGSFLAPRFPGLLVALLKVEILKIHRRGKRQSPKSLLTNEAEISRAIRTIAKSRMSLKE
jgi:hypothetical protein